MNFFKKLVVLVSLTSFTWGQVSFAAAATTGQQQLPDLNQMAQKVLTQKLDKFQTEEGAILEDEAGHQLTTAQLVTGGYSTLVVRFANNTLLGAKGIRLIYKGNVKDQSVVLTAMNSQNERLAARVFKINPSKDPKESALEIQQTMKSFDQELKQALAKVTGKLDRMPALSALSALCILINGMSMWMNWPGCRRNVTPSNPPCLIIALNAFLILISL